MDEEAVSKEACQESRLTQDICVADGLAGRRIMAKNEDVCLHCGLCSTRCPTAAWDMQKFWYNVTKAGEVKYDNFVQIERNGAV